MNETFTHVGEGVLKRNGSPEIKHPLFVYVPLEDYERLVRLAEKSLDELMTAELRRYLLLIASKVRNNHLANPSAVADELEKQAHFLPEALFESVMK